MLSKTNIKCPLNKIKLRFSYPNDELDIKNIKNIDIMICKSIFAKMLLDMVLYVQKNYILLY